MMPVWKDRIILPNETEILPERVIEINLRSTIGRDYPSVTYIDSYRYPLLQEKTASLTGARIDQRAPALDRTGATIYERDMVSSLMHFDGTGIVILDRDGMWKMEKGKRLWVLAYDAPVYLTVIGHVPYAEDSGQ